MAILDLGLILRSHPHRLRIAHGRRDRRLVDGERGEKLMQLARDLAAEAGADLADIDQGLALASCQMQGGNRAAVRYEADVNIMPVVSVAAFRTHSP